ncbi:MAG: galactokinase [Clostridia bacterium]|nr:galactokinase [Clostridia bacterium]
MFDFELLSRIYGGRDKAEKQLKRLNALKERFTQLFGDGGEIVFVSAPGRTEIAGNHTDHNYGKVLAASVDLDTLAAVRANGTDTVNLYSDMYEEPFRVDISALEPAEAEKETTAALIRGSAAGVRARGGRIGGFDACVTSNVLRGSGLSSSAAFEVLLVRIFDELFSGGVIPAEENARISQKTENRFFMKPCGLMDQMACAVGGMVYIDFAGGNAQVESIKYDFSAKGLTPCVVAAGGDHGNLTGEYASIPAEMKAVANALGGSVLREVEDRIYSSVPLLKGRVSDRAILRALHFADENRRVGELAQALKRDDINAFLEGIIASGESSWKLLQNLYVPGGSNEEMPLALEMSARLLKGKGAWRIHGGGFAGTILVFVPTDELSAYTQQMEAVFGQGSVKPLFIRPEGVIRLA